MDMGLVGLDFRMDLGLGIWTWSIAFWIELGLRRELGLTLAWPTFGNVHEVFGLAQCLAFGVKFGPITVDLWPIDLDFQLLASLIVVALKIR